MPSVTVVLPLYNQAQYVYEALSSVLSQTYRDMEIIVVDDGSTDGGACVVQTVADSRVRLVRQPNQGVSCARNRGIEMATSDYVAFLDADDRWQPVFLERCFSLLKRYPSVNTVYTNAVDERTARPRLDVSCCPEGMVADYFATVLRCHRHLGIPSSVVVQAKALRKAGGFPPGVNYYEDHDLWMRLAWVSKVGYLAEPLAFYRDNPSGAMERLRQAGAPYPYPVHTYRRWKHEGRIPANLLRTTREFVNWTLLGYVCNLANAGDIVRARRVFCNECRWTSLALRSYGAALLLCTVPAVGRTLWRYHAKRAEQQVLSSATQAVQAG